MLSQQLFTSVRTRPKGPWIGLYDAIMVLLNESRQVRIGELTPIRDRVPGDIRKRDTLSPTNDRLVCWRLLLICRRGLQSMGFPAVRQRIYNGTPAGPCLSDIPPATTAD